MPLYVTTFMYRAKVYFLLSATGNGSARLGTYVTGTADCLDRLIQRRHDESFGGLKEWGCLGKGCARHVPVVRLEMPQKGYSVIRLSPSFNSKRKNKRNLIRTT